MLFGKREVLVTYDLNIYQSATNALYSANIEYKTKRASNRARRTRGRYGSLGENDSVSILYYVYVKASDYEEALHIIRSRCFS